MYSPVNGGIECEKCVNYSNRLIFEANDSVYIMAGERPLLRLGEQRCILGTLRLYAGNVPLDEFEQIRMRYEPGVIRWQLKDRRFQNGKEFHVSVTSPGEGRGLVLKAENSTELAVLFRGMYVKQPDPGYSVGPTWNLNVKVADRSLLRTVFDESGTMDNRARTEGDLGCLSSEAVDHVLGKTSPVYLSADGGCYVDGNGLRGSVKEYLLITLRDLPGDRKAAFEAGLVRRDRFKAEMTLETPDEYINSCAREAVAEMDAAWHPPKTMHGVMSWNQPFVGWLAHGHHTVGNYQRSLETLRVYAAAQVKEDEKRGYETDPTGSRPAESSRFYGQGYIKEDQLFYNMQTQFFHQMIRAWRYSGNEELKKILKDALRLHLKREDECFDPDGTGLYESVINTWPTDSVFHSGGGSVEETCYVYAAAKAMADLCEGEEKKHWSEKALHIKKAFFSDLWIGPLGYSGAWIDRSGNKRLHRDAWLYSSFLPVECGLTDEYQAAQALFYPYWALKQDEHGMFWNSNWVPGIWSVRECTLGENMQQAIAFFKGGKAEAALKLLKNVARKSMDGEIPGDLTNPTIEGAMQFARALVEGLFGYDPDYPSGTVTICPRLPYEWQHARLCTKDVHISFDNGKWSVKLTRPARLILRLRVYGDRVTEVHGAAEWHIEPGLNGLTCVIDAGTTSGAEIRLDVENPHDFDEPLECRSLPEGELLNPQGVDKNSFGHHMVFLKTPHGYYREVHLDLGPDPKAEELRRRQKSMLPEHPVFEQIDLGEQVNCRTEDIFKQNYSSPRPSRGCSTSIGYDGFTIWTFPFWNVTPPAMSVDCKGIVTAPSGIPYSIREGKNVAFVSLWDNFPDNVFIPVLCEGRMACLLVAGSTNPMQCGIENARLTFRYEDGAEEELPLINPENYISLCPYPRRAATEGSGCRSDVFDNPYDADIMKDFLSEPVPLGQNLRGLSIKWPLKPGSKLNGVTLTALSNDVVVGLMALTIVK